MQDDPVGNINLAMEIAEKHLDIPKMLDAEGEMKMIIFNEFYKIWMTWCHVHTGGSVTYEIYRTPKKFFLLTT